ncbi:MAG: hypothetical protein ACK5TK_17940 [Betaproteobacteria bacterium]
MRPIRSSHSAQMTQNGVPISLAARSAAACGDSEALASPLFVHALGGRQ